MATVTGFTAARMLAIEQASVVDGYVAGDDLILVTQAGVLINTGNVRGPIGATGPASASLNDIGDVDASETDGYVVAWDMATSKWIGISPDWLPTMGGVLTGQLKLKHTSDEKLMLVNGSTPDASYIAFYTIDEITNRARFGIDTAGKIRLDVYTTGQGFHVTSPSSQVLILDQVVGSPTGPYIDLSRNGVRAGFVGFPGNDSVYIQNDVTNSIRLVPAYDNTTAAAANTYLDASSTVKRSTSSLRFKKDVEPLDDTHARKILDLKPIWYRSTCDGDPSEWSWYGFGAEDVAEVDPRLVFWEPTPNCSCAKDDEEIAVEDHSAECLRPAGVQYDRLVPHVVSILKQYEARIASFESRIRELERSIKKLVKES